MIPDILVLDVVTLLNCNTVTVFLSVTSLHTSKLSGNLQVIIFRHSQRSPKQHVDHEKAPSHQAKHKYTIRSSKVSILAVAQLETLLRRSDIRI